MKGFFRLSLLLSLFCFQSQAYALTLQDEISAYEKNNYAQAIAIGDQLAKENASDANCHYYLANAYSRLGRIEEAIREYSVCINLTEDPQLRQYCDQALMFLTKNQPAQRNITASGLTQMTSASSGLAQHRINSSGLRVVHNRGSEVIYAPTAKLGTDDLKSIGKVRPAPVQLASSGTLDSLLGQGTIFYNKQTGKFEPEHQINPLTSLPNGAPSPQFLQSLAAAGRPQLSTIPGYMKALPYSQRAYINSLFNAAPMPPPPFPVSAKKGAEQALKQTVK